MMEGFGERLHYLRKKHHLSYEELANKINVTNQELKLWEKGKKRPPIRKLDELAQVYAVDLEQLVPNRILTNHQVSEILKEAEGGRGTLYLKNVSTQPFFPNCLVKNARIIEIKKDAMKIQVRHNDAVTRHILPVPAVIGFLEEIN